MDGGICVTKFSWEGCWDKRFECRSGTINDLCPCHIWQRRGHMWSWGRYLSFVHSLFWGATFSVFKPNLWHSDHQAVFPSEKRCWSRGNAFCSIPDSLTCAYDSVAGGEAGTVTSNSMFAAMLVVLPPDFCGVNIRYVLFIVCEPSAPSRRISRHHIMGWGKASAATHYQRPRRIWSRKVVLSTHQRKASNDKILEWVDSTKSFW